MFTKPGCWQINQCVNIRQQGVSISSRKLSFVVYLSTVPINELYINIWNDNLAAIRDVKLKAAISNREVFTVK